MKRSRRITIWLLAFFGVTLGTWVSCSPLGLSRRVAQVDARAESYAAELRANPGTIGGFKVSPDGRYVALSQRVVDSFSSYLYHAIRDTLPAWVFSHYSTVSVVDGWSGERRSIVSIREAKVGSGTSHGFRWSADSRALFVTGSGSMNFNESESLCLVYLVAEDALLRPASCM